MKINLRCLIFGHDIPEETDGGYCYCTRCSGHEYYSGYDSIDDVVKSRYNEWTLTIPFLYYEFRYWIICQFRKVYHKCWQCGKVNMLFGKHTGNHDNCLPF